RVPSRSAPAAAGARATASEAVHKAGGKGQPVTQEIKMSVKGSRVSCSINGTEGGTWDKADLPGGRKLETGASRGGVPGEGKPESVQGGPGIRVAHNVDVKVSNFKVEKQ